MSAHPVGRPPSRRVIAAAGAVVAVALAACGSEATPERGEGMSAPARTSAPPSAAAHATEKDFDAGSFSDPLRIDNAWSPLEPGMRFVYEGRANRGQGRLPHRVVFTVTDLTKVIDGVRSVVLWDRDFNGGRLREGELAFHAQDDDGNIWNMGEYPEEYDGGRVAGAPDTWISGVAGARAGVLMRGLPRPGTPSYLQQSKYSLEQLGQRLEWTKGAHEAAGREFRRELLDHRSPHFIKVPQGGISNKQVVIMAGMITGQRQRRSFDDNWNIVMGWWADQQSGETA